MNQAINQFRINLSYVHNLAGVYSALKNTTTTALDLSDILRAELVMGVSALDKFIHSAVEEGMLEIYQGQRKNTAEFNEFNIELFNINQAIKNPTDTTWLQYQIRKNLGYQSFQKSDKISSVLKLITDKKLWDEVSTILRDSKNQITLKLDLIINRRNIIVHEADVNPTYNIRYQIDEIEVNESVKHIENICEAIFQVVK